MEEGLDKNYSVIENRSKTAINKVFAAFKGEEEMLTGVVENLIVGQPVKVGTGIVELLMK